MPGIPSKGRLMKQKLLALVFVIATVAHAASLDAGASGRPDLKPEPQEAHAARMSADLLQRYHYKKVPLDNAMSEKIFNQYLKTLDPEKVYFLQSDVDEVSADRARLDDAILNEDLVVPFEIF